MTTATVTEAASTSEDVPWKLRVEEPTNRFVYYPIARWLVRGLVHTPVTANQVTLVQPLFAGAAAWLVATSNDPKRLLVAALLFETRSLLDCVDGTLARAKGTASTNGHAMDAICDWLGGVLLYVGLAVHFLRFPPAADWTLGGWAALGALPVLLVLASSLFQGAVRSLAADYFLRKLGSIFATGVDDTVEGLREKQRRLRPDSPFWAKVEAWIGRCQHLSFQHERFDAERTRSLDGAQAQALSAERNGPTMRLLSTAWSLSNGDFFLRATVASLLFGPRWMWELQVVFATVGLPWIFGLCWLNGSLIRRRLGSGTELPNPAE
jgi:phosphatidylglycerophosphate synthase